MGIMEAGEGLSRGCEERLTQGCRLASGESRGALKEVGLCSGLGVVRLQG